MWWKYISRWNCWKYDNVRYITWKSLYKKQKTNIQKINVRNQRQIYKRWKYRRFKLQKINWTKDKYTKDIKLLKKLYKIPKKTKVQMKSYKSLSQMKVYIFDKSSWYFIPAVRVLN